MITHTSPAFFFINVFNLRTILLPLAMSVALPGVTTTVQPSVVAATETRRPANAPDSTSDATVISMGASQLNVNVMKNAMPPLPTFPALSAKPGIVRGFVKDSNGRPLQGAVIGVRSSAAGGFYSGASGKSDARGYYEIVAPWGAAAFYTASCTLDYGDGRAAFGLHPADGAADSFATARGLVKNWVLLPYGVADRDTASDNPKYRGNYYGGTFTVSYSVADSRFTDDYSLPDGAEVAVTLTPDGPLLGGATGRRIVIRRPVCENGNTLFYINNVPVGRYQISARLLHNGAATALRLVETGPEANNPFGLEPKEGKEGVMLTFRPGSAKAGMSPATRGNWDALSVTLKR